MMTGIYRHTLSFSRRDFRLRLANSVALSIQRAQGKPGAGGTRFTVCGV